jgi:phage portal protein BeeE
MAENDLIKKYTFKYDDNTTEDIDLRDMIYLTTDDGINLIRPISRIESLKYPLSNIKAQYHKRNVLLENIGAIGILSAKNSDIGGAIVMTPEEKKALQKDWYNRQKDDLIITEADLNWTPMSYPTRDLMLFEELTADKLALIDAYGLNANIFSSVNGATYTNVRDSVRMVYTDTIIPETQQMYDTIMHQFGLAQQGYYLKAEFDHLPVLQHDEKLSSEAEKIKVDTYSVLLRDGIITREQFAIEFGIDFQGTNTIINEN